MALIRWRPRTEMDPFRDMMGIQEEINRLFDWTLGRRSGEDLGLLQGEWVPAIDVAENESSVFVKVELPGMSEKDVDVNILGNTLTIKGQKTKEEEKKDQNYYRLERSYGSFQRSVTLPSAVEADKCKASFKDGVLEIEMPKKEEAKPKQIKVNVG
jgi:HSP20 family protein